jgi:hypothetical protein
MLSAFTQCKLKYIQIHSEESQAMAEVNLEGGKEQQQILICNNNWAFYIDHVHESQSTTVCYYITINSHGAAIDVRSFSTPIPWSETKGWGTIDTIIINNLRREEDRFKKINKEGAEKWKYKEKIFT